MGVSTVDKLVEHVEKSFSTQSPQTTGEVKKILSHKALEIMNSADQGELSLDQKSPFVILVVGVNGAGKTTTIGKIAAHFIAKEKSVLLCAADTYRAAAIDQLKAWGDRLGIKVINQKPGSDPAAVAFDSVKAAKARNTDVVIIDTAGRLQNKTDLMKELSKIKRVIEKDLTDAPHETLLVVDATTGQNAFSQVETFREVADVSGLVVTKVDGTAKGGVLIGITDKYKIPIRYVGFGEKISDLRPFKANEYINTLFE